MKKYLAFGIVGALTLTGCVSTSNIAPQYINPSVYQHHDCTSLQSEVARITQLANATEKQNISLGTGVGIGISAGRGGIYPSISLGTGIGSGQRQAKKNTLAKLYGEHDAMVLAGRQKGCGFVQGMKIYGE